jgi:hypothetical protein
MMTRLLLLLAGNVLVFSIAYILLREISLGGRWSELALVLVVGGVFAAPAWRQPLRTSAVFLLFALVNSTVAIFLGVSFYL